MTNRPQLRRPKNSSLVELAYEAIVEAIFNRSLEPGSHVSLGALASDLEMSTTPVREALARASTEKLVTQNSNRGFTVTPLLSEHRYHQLFAVRSVLEDYAIRSAEPEPSYISRLEELVSQMPEMKRGPVYQDFREFNEADQEFHRILVSMANNDLLLDTWEGLHFHLHVGRLYAGAGVIDFREALQEHESIVSGVRADDRDAAVSAARLHMSNAECRLQELLPTSSRCTARPKDA